MLEIESQFKFTKIGCVNSIPKRSPGRNHSTPLAEITRELNTQLRRDPDVRGHVVYSTLILET